MSSLCSFDLDQVELGPMQNYIYVISDKKTKDALVVDPAWDVPAISSLLDKKGLSLKGVLITHGHPDHTNGLKDIGDSYDVPIYVSGQEASLYRPICDGIIETKDGDVVSIGDTDVTLLATPGHTPGSQCFLVQDALISGDTLFLDGCGRCDLPFGDPEVLYDSLTNKIMKLPQKTIIYPGHNYHHLKSDPLENQKKTNPYLQCSSLRSFLHERMGL